MPNRIYIATDPDNTIRWGTDPLDLRMHGPAVRFGVDFATKRYDGIGKNHEGVEFPLEVHVQRMSQVDKIIAQYEISVTGLKLAFDADTAPAPTAAHVPQRPRMR